MSTTLKPRDVHVVCAPLRMSIRQADSEDKWYTREELEDLYIAQLERQHQQTLRGAEALVIATKEQTEVSVSISVGGREVLPRTRIL